MSAKAYRVEFRASVVLDTVNDRGHPTQDYVDVTVSADKTIVTPAALIDLYQPTDEVRRIARLFPPTAGRGDKKRIVTLRSLVRRRP